MKDEDGFTLRASFTHSSFILLPSSFRTISSVALIGIDLGGKRIGVAVSESGALARPHSVLRNEGDVIAKLTGLAGELDAETFVVGIPGRAHASPAEQKYRTFAEELRQRSRKEVVLWDESLTTVEAAERLRRAGRTRRDAQR